MKYLLILLVFFAGCAGSCISVGGSYDGKYSGNIEYCFDSAESERSGTIAFDTGNGEKSYSFSEDIIKGLLDKLKDKVGIKTINSEGKVENHPVKELLKLLEKEE